VRPAWLDRVQYPFAPHWFHAGVGRLHYVDEGKGAPLLMVHGTPTWSFLYRHLVKALSGRYRCIVPDHLGFGLSDRPVSWSYRPRDQARILVRFVESLGLKDLTLIVHDFGGPIGLNYALEHPRNVRRLVLLNTWMWSFADDRRLRWGARLLGSGLGRMLYRHFDFAVTVMLRRSIADRKRYTREVERHYRRPLDGRATWVYARELLASGEWYERLWQQRERITGIPTLLLWGMKDPAFAACLSRWRDAFTQAQVIELADCGHAPPEERAPELLPFLEQFLQTV
jgi:haloalkane dehalogenase